MKIIQHLLEHNLFKILAFFWTILIFYFCLEEAPNVPKFSFPNKDKIVHFIFYFVFVFLWIKSLKKPIINSFLIVLISAILFGISIELIQENFTKNRAFDWYDILANSFGAITSFVLSEKILNKKRI